MCAGKQHKIKERSNLGGVLVGTRQLTLPQPSSETKDQQCLPLQYVDQKNSPITTAE